MDSFKYLVQKWQEYLSKEKNFSEHTYAAYLTDLQQFLSFIQEYQGENCSINILAKLTIKDFRSWLTQRKKDNFANSSTARAIAAVKNFYRYLIRFHNFTNKAIFSLRTPKIQEILPKALNIEQANNALNMIEEVASEPWIAKRDEALLYLIYGCGLRISEALAVKVSELGSDTLRIIGKGNKERIVPVLPQVLGLIKEYLAVCPYNIKNDEFVFIGKNGKALDPGVFQRQIRKLRRTLNLPESTTPHAFRHSFATHILSNGGDLKSIQELLGHQDLTTTQRYTKIDPTHLLNIYKKSHPFS